MRIVLPFLLGLFCVSWPVLAGPINEELGKKYLAISSDLAADSFENSTRQAKEISGLINADAAAMKSDLYKKIAESAQTLSRAKDIKEARTSFKAFSENMKTWFEKEKPAGVELMFCPMEKGYWVQKAGEATKNPYYGTAMASCGYSVTKKLK